MAVIERTVFECLLCRYAGVGSVADSMVLFGSDLNVSSIAFTEFIMELEEATDINIDVDNLDVSVRTVGQLWAKLVGP